MNRPGIPDPDRIDSDLERQCRELVATELQLDGSDVSDRFRIRIEGGMIVAAFDGYTTRAPLGSDLEADVYSIGWAIIEALRRD